MEEILKIPLWLVQIDTIRISLLCSVHLYSWTFEYSYAVIQHNYNRALLYVVEVPPTLHVDEHEGGLDGALLAVAEAEVSHHVHLRPPLHHRPGQPQSGNPHQGVDSPGGW